MYFLGVSRAADTVASSSNRSCFCVCVSCRETEYLVIAVAALESAIAEHGRHADKKFPTFVKLSHVAVTGEVFNMFGTSLATNVSQGKCLSMAF